MLIDSDGLRYRLRRSRLLRNIWASVRLVRWCAYSLPDWLTWHWEKGKTSTANSKSAEMRLDSLHIAFVSSRARVREFKLAYAARLHGHRVTLIASRVDSPDNVKEYFNSFHKAENAWQALYWLEQLQPDVVHLFVCYNNIVMLPVLLFAPCPVVYDPYDCVKGMFRPEYQLHPLELFAERVCFARASHICARSLEPLYLRRNFGYRMPAVTYFPEYCWNEPIRRSVRKVGKDEPLHIVYCGGIFPEGRYPSEEYGYAQYLEIGRILASQKIHLHIYPAVPPMCRNFKEFFAIYIEESEKNPYFHFYEPFSNRLLRTVLRNYHAAIHIMGTSINGSLGHATRAKLDYSTANKIFDYIEAGLPVVIHNGKHQRGLVRHYGEIVEIHDLSEVRQALTQVLARAASDSRSIPTLSRQAHRLDSMYRGVITQCGL